MSEAVFLAIGAAGAFARAGLSFPLPARWEDDQSFWSDDNRVREAFGVDDDDAAATKIRKRIKSSGLRKACTLVFARRMMEIQLGVREEDSALAWLYRLGRSAVFAMLPQAAAEFFADFDDYASELSARFRAAGADTPADVLRKMDDAIDDAIRRAGYTPKAAR